MLLSLLRGKPRHPADAQSTPSPEQGLKANVHRKPRWVVRLAREVWYGVTLFVTVGASAWAAMALSDMGQRSTSQTLPEPLFWPPLALATLGVMLWGRNAAVGAGAGIGAVYALVLGWPVWLSVLGALAIGGVLATVAVSLKALGGRSDLSGRHDIGSFLLLTVACTSLASACLGHVGQWMLSQSPPTVTDWVIRLLRDALSIMGLTLPILALRGVRAPRHAHPSRWAGGALLASGSILGVGMAFGSPPASPSAPPSETILLFLFLPPLFVAWLGRVSSWRLASVLAAVLSAGALALFQLGGGPIAHPVTNTGLILLFAYGLTLTGMPLLVGSLQRESEYADEQWVKALGASQIGSAEWDDETDEVRLSPTWLSFLEYREQSFGHSRQSLWNHIHPDDRPIVREGLMPLSERAQTESVVFRMRARDGNWRWLQGHAIVLQRGRLGSPRKVRATVQDVTRQRAIQERQELSTQLFQHLHEGLLVTDDQYRVLDANPTFTRITGYTREEMLGQIPVLLRAAAPGTPGAEAQQAVQRSLQATGSWHGELDGYHRDGTPCVLQVTISAVFNLSGAVAFFVLAMIDITQSRARKSPGTDESEPLSADSLTMLPNRIALEPELKAALKSSEKEGFLLTVACIDLDHFSGVNQRHGHETGNVLLRLFAERLQSCAHSYSPEFNSVARLGADEFAILLRSENRDQALGQLNRIHQRLSQPYMIGQSAEELPLGCSIGATVYPLDREESQTLLRHAEQAKYAAKQSGRNRVHLFDPEDRARNEAKSIAQTQLQSALDQGQLLLYYQPTIDLANSALVALEALLRWKHPQHGVIAPAQFLPLIQQTPVAERLNNWVFESALGQLAQWQENGLDVMVHVNINAQDLMAPDFLSRLQALLDRHGVFVAHRLVLEILETSALGELDRLQKVMQQCREIGIRFAADDFGTGYSSLSHLKSLPLDILKIDRSFVNNMLNDPQDLAIVEGVIALSETFNCQVIAEGLKTQEQAARLLELGCTFAQGNSIAPAMPAQNVLAWAESFQGVSTIVPVDTQPAPL